MKFLVGIAGYGLSGKTFHLPLLRSLPEDFEVRALAAGSRTVEAAREIPEVEVVATVEELVQIPDLDLAIIATPSGLHAQHARAALDAGLHVVLEKPFASTTQEAAALAKEAEKRGKLLAVFHNRRLDADFLTLKELLGQGTLGQVREAEFRWDRYRPQVLDRWKERTGPGSGLFWDLSPHLMDQAIQLFGPFDWVWADLENQRLGAQADDWFHVLLGHGKTRVILHGGSLAPSPGFHYRIQGDAAAFLSYGEDPQEALLRSGALPGCPLWGFLPNAGVLLWPDGSQERRDLTGGDWRRFYQGLAAALRGIGPPPVDVREALAVLALMEAALKSSVTGRKILL